MCMKTLLIYLHFQKFAPRGLRRSTFFGGYGLAESTLIVSGRKKETDEVRFIRIDANELTSKVGIV